MTQSSTLRQPIGGTLPWAHDGRWSENSRVLDPVWITIKLVYAPRAGWLTNVGIYRFEVVLTRREGGALWVDGIEPLDGWPNEQGNIRARRSRPLLLRALHEAIEAKAGQYVHGVSVKKFAKEETARHAAH